jgi:hypothetical protein
MCHHVHKPAKWYVLLCNGFHVGNVDGVIIGELNNPSHIKKWMIYSWCTIFFLQVMDFDFLHAFIALHFLYSCRVIIVFPKKESFTTLVFLKK